MKFAFFTRLLTALVFFNIVFYSNLTLVANAQGTAEPTQPERTNKQEINQSQDKPETLNTILGDIRDELVEDPPWYESTLVSTLLSTLGGFIGGLAAVYIGYWLSERTRKASRRESITEEILKDWDQLHRGDRNLVNAAVLKPIKEEGSQPVPYSTSVKENMALRNSITKITEYFNRLDSYNTRGLILAEPTIESDIPIDYVDWEDNYFSWQRTYEANGDDRSLFKGPYPWLRELAVI